MEFQERSESVVEERQVNCEIKVFKLNKGFSYWQYGVVVNKKETNKLVKKKTCDKELCTNVYK